MNARLLPALMTAAVLLFGGCGSEEPKPSAADQVPALADRLERIDGLVADRKPQRARAQLETLLDEVMAAREAGDLTAVAADRIIAAATALIRALPEPEPEPLPTVTVTPVNPDPDNGDDDKGKGEGKGEKDDDKGGKGKGKDD